MDKPEVSDIINNDYVLITLYVDNKTPLPSPREDCGERYGTYAAYRRRQVELSAARQVRRQCAALL